MKFWHVFVTALLLTVPQMAYAEFTIPSLGIVYTDVAAAVATTFGAAFAAFFGLKVAVVVAKKIASLLRWGTS